MVGQEVGINRKEGVYVTQDDRKPCLYVAFSTNLGRLMWPKSLLDDFLDTFEKDVEPRGLTLDQYLMALLLSQNALAKQFGMDLSCSVDWEEVEKHREALGIRELKPEEAGESRA